MRKTCLFDEGVDTGRDCFCPPCPINHRWGKIFNLPDLQQHCLWPILLIAVEQNGLVVQTTPPPPPALPHPPAPSPDGVSAVASVCFPGARWIEKDRGNSAVEREGENEKEMHGQMGLKWQQSALMETDGRMRREELRRWRRGCVCERRRLLKSQHDGWRGGRRQREASQGDVDAAGTAHGPVAKWRRVRRKSQRESDGGKGELDEEGNGDGEGFWRECFVCGARRGEPVDGPRSPVLP